MLITEAARGEGAHLINNKKERFLRDYIPDSMEMGPRDIISRAIYKETQAGRAIDTPCGKCVHLDLRHLGKKIITQKLPQLRDLTLTYLNLDPIIDPIPATPAQHYFMGGIATDIETKTNIPGLLAVGESACASVNGANRLGSNSLAKCLVFGTESGKTAAKIIGERKQPQINPSQIKDEQSRIKKIIQRKGKENPHAILEEMNAVMETRAGVIRNEKGLQEGLKVISKLKEQINK